MAFIYRARTYAHWSGTGTGNIVPVPMTDTSYQAFADVMADGDTTDIVIFGAEDFESCEAEWDVGTGALIRGTIHESSNSDLRVDFGAGLKTVMMTLPATKAARLFGLTQGLVPLVGAGGALALASAAASFGWTTSAADAGIDFGSGSAITRRSADGHVRIASQNSVVELPAGHTLTVGTILPESGAGVDIRSAGFNLVVTNPTLTVDCPTFADFATTNTAAMSIYETMSAHGAGSELNSALLVQNIIPSTTTGSGAAGGITGGFVNGKDGTDAYGVLGIVNNQGATVTAPSGAAIWGLIRGDLGGVSGVGFIDGIRTTSEVSNVGGNALATVTVSLASPGVVTYTSHALVANQQVMFSNGGGGALPASLSFETLYYVKAVLGVNTFTVSATKGGTAINTASASTGTIKLHSPQRPRGGVFVNNNQYCNPFLAGVYVEGAVEYGYRVGSGNSGDNVWEPTYPFGYVRKGGSSPTFYVDTAGAVNAPNLKILGASGNISWPSLAADAGIDFGGGGSTITRRAADGHLQFTSQNNVFEFTGNSLTIGQAGSVVGSLSVFNATSGSVKLQPVTGALGTPTINIPAASGTMAVSATAPIALSAAGAISFNAATVTNSISGGVALNNTGSYFDGPSVAQGTSGTWLATGTVSLVDNVGAAVFNVKLWDGTTLIASAVTKSTAAGADISVSLSGVITSPAANIRISVNDATSTSGFIGFNRSGNAKDSTVTAIRIG